METVLLYNIMVDPKPQMFITCDAGLIKTGVNTRIEAMINNAGARPLIFAQSKKAKGKEYRDTGSEKQYPGGFLHFVQLTFRKMAYG